MERHYLTMRYIIKAVDRPVGATEHFISAVVYCKYCSIERISSYYISCLPELLKISCQLKYINRDTEVSDTNIS